MNGQGNKILLFLKLPPPLTGATSINKYVYNSPLLSESFSLIRLGVSYARSVKDIGSFSFRKIRVYSFTLFKYLKILTFQHVNLIYFQPSIKGLPFYRDLIYILIGRLFGKTFLLHLHGKGIAEIAVKSKIKLILYKLGFSKQFIIVLSQNQINDISFAAPKLIYIVPNGLPIVNREIISKKIKNSSSFKFLFLSNFFHSKGVYDLLNAAILLKNLQLDYLIDIVGGAGDITHEQLNSFISRNGLSSHVLVHDPVYDEKKFAFYEDANAFVFPTKNEAFGLVILEAMQFSLPVISTDEGAIKELVKDGINGFIVPKSDINALAQKMRFFVENPEISKMYGTNGHSVFFEKYTLGIFESAMKNVFDEVLKKKCCANRK